MSLILTTPDTHVRKWRRVQPAAILNRTAGGTYINVACPFAFNSASYRRATITMAEPVDRMVIELSADASYAPTINVTGLCSASDIRFAGRVVIPVSHVKGDMVIVSDAPGASVARFTAVYGEVLE